MKRIFYIFLAFTLLFPTCALAQTDNKESKTIAKEQYRRSSLCLILLTHKDKKYAQAMERVFKSFPLPARYNEHNITDLRVISVRGKQSKSDIDQLLRSNEVAQKIVGKWFNRNSYTGKMDMDLIHERGGYGASYSDYQRAKNHVRGTALLRDEGIELLQNTFVLVCDMDYIDKKKHAKWGSFGMALLSGVMKGMAQANYQQAVNSAYYGNSYEAQRKLRAARAWDSGSTLSMAGAAVVSNIGGFRVKMNAYLYKLTWDDAMTQRMYNDYWIDETTAYSESQSRKRKFDNEDYAFKLKYVGNYRTSSSKTILRNWKNEDEVILDVCERCVNKGIKELAKSFVVFRPRSPFYFEGSSMYSYIGKKEDVGVGKKYEIIKPYKDKKGQIKYKRVGKVRATSSWNNTKIRFDEYFDSKEKGSRFSYNQASVDLHTPGLQLREL